MTTNKPLLGGGSFAPPLSDDILSGYDALLATLDPQEQTTDIIAQLLACVRAWWQEPESGGAGKPHPYLGNRAMRLDLAPEIAARLWEAIPWGHDLETWKGILDALEADKAERNSEKLSVWQRSLRLALYTVVAPGLNPDSLESCARLYHATQRLCLPLGKPAAQAAAAAAAAAAFPGWSGETAVKQVATVASAHIAAVKGISATLKELAIPETALPPRPTLEPTPLRDMAHSLLWHACELERDREPLTCDKLR